MATDLKQLNLTTRQTWRRWLEKNHKTSTGVWLVYHKKHTGKPRIPYNDAVEEAICFGWIDSIIKRLDNDRYMQKFTPRNPRSRWSQLNKKRAARMTKLALMTPAGLAAISDAKKAGRWNPKQPAIPELKMPDDFRRALAKNKEANANFNQLAPSYRKNYLAWILFAKRPETRARRIEEAITLLSRNEKLGMK